MKNYYDVIIVGAGPAGLCCALELQKSDLSVLVLEKNKIVGQKVCAGGITPKVADFGVPFENADVQFSSILASVSNKKVKVSYKGRLFLGTIDRIKLGKILSDQLSEKTTLKLDSEVSEISKNFVLVEEKRIGYKYLVGADGSHSVVRKFLGLKMKKAMVVIEYFIQSELKDLEFCLDADLFGPGYGWIFPHKDYVSVGCGRDNRFSKGWPELTETFEKWLKLREIDTQGAKLQAGIINADFQGFDFGNVFLVGDAGGFASNLTGEGIYFGMVSGREVAKKIINPSYKCPEIFKILKIRKDHERVTNFIFSVMLINKSLANILLKFLLNLTQNRLFSWQLLKFLE